MVDRRSLLLGITAMSVLPVAARADEPNAWGFSFPSLEDGTLWLKDYHGRVLLVTNTASFCGFAPQFRTLEALNRGRGTDGLTVVGMLRS